MFQLVHDSYELYNKKKRIIGHLEWSTTTKFQLENKYDL